MNIGTRTHAKILVQIRILTWEMKNRAKSYFVHDKTEFAKTIKVSLTDRENAKWTKTLSKTQNPE